MSVSAPLVLMPSEEEGDCLNPQKLQARQRNCKCSPQSVSSTKKTRFSMILEDFVPRFLMILVIDRRKLCRQGRAVIFVG